MPLSPRVQWKLDRFRDSVKSFFGGGQQNARPRLCPSCGTLVGSTATKCHVCGANVRFGIAAAGKSLGRMMPSNSPVTYAVMCVCFLLYGISLLLTLKIGGSVMPEGGGIGALFGIGSIANNVSIALGNSIPLPYVLRFIQPWRFVTAIFLHGSLLHILFNMWVLMDIGPMVEELYGSARYFALFIFTGAVGFVASSMINNFSVGASGSLLGLIGLLIAATTGRRSAGAQMVRTQLIRWVIYILIIGFVFRGLGTDNAAHIGGLAAGFGLGKIVPDRQPTGPDEQRRARAIGWATAVVVLACFGFMVAFFFSPDSPLSR
ncbi:MAG TPA: rhomboid family intramembrane serine protease [Candidatus Acidoferrum sp.]|nr:rhomboid family intramembrane serine protease [Candidatus Acidoferrum sp.]